ncbi:unnamed protein product [Oppiella nova]|uniref:Negative elongation factor E n=1 Tax=Oppiella nova TaxID=334625 RepID=A0A7R9M5S9_9ACAR|nr:unnamed protein product [Oppiella nova]CAG2170133.1 unnamed protein product [Oppiella nova]
MVFIQIPTQLTDEELMLQRKYQKLKRKKKALQAMKAPKPEPQPIQPTKFSCSLSPCLRFLHRPKFSRKALERKRCGGADKPGGYQPFHMSHSTDEDNVALEDMPSTRVKPLYESFVSSRDPESIAREETFREKRRDGKANYVNRDTPQTGNTIYVHGFGVNESILRTGFSIFGNILNITSESDKNCGFVTFDSIESANKAIDEMNKKSVNGIQLKVMLARRQPAVVPKTETTDLGAHSSAAPDVWSTIAATYSQKSGLKDKRSLISYEESDVFASM